MKNIITFIEPKNKLFLDTIDNNFSGEGYDIRLFDSASELIYVRLVDGVVTYVSSSALFEKKKLDYGAMREIADITEYRRKRLFEARGLI